MKKKIILTVAVFVIAIAVAFFTVISNNPIAFHRFINTIKYQIASLFAPHELTVTSAIALAPGGDMNKNGKIDAGDTIRFSYTITNTTEKTYKFATLKTNLDRTSLNFIHNLQDSDGYVDTGKTLNLPNLWVDSNQKFVISFDARINYYKNVDKTISTTAQLVDANGALIAQAQKDQIVAKRMQTGSVELPGSIELTTK